MLREQTFDTGTVAINYAADTASGPPLVLLHGIMGWWQAWLPVMPDLALRWRLYALDLRGHGRSGRANGAYTLMDYADDVIALLRQVVGEPTVVVGHSLGAMITIAVAARAPELVRAIVLEDPPLAPFSHTSIRNRPEREPFTIVRDLAARGGTTDDLIPAFRDLAPELDPAALRARARRTSQLDPDVLTTVLEDRGAASYDLNALLRRIAAPALLLQGNPAHGGALDDTDARNAASLLARGTHVYLADVGHGIHTAQPRTFSRIVHDFLESL